MDLSDISLASITLDSSTCADIICGSNGLPLTPNSIKIIGEFRARVEKVDHPNLVKYVDCFKNKNERVTLVSEDRPSKVPNDLDPIKTAHQLLDALYHLHTVVDCTHGLITTDSFVWSGNNFKLAHWPINLLTNSGRSLGSKIILPMNTSFISPEQAKNPCAGATKKSDIWSAGLALLKLIKPNCNIPDNPCRLAYCSNSQQVIEIIDGKLDDSIVSDSIKWNSFFERVLEPNPEIRSSLEYLYSALDLVAPDNVRSPLLVPLVSNLFDIKQKDIMNLKISEVYYLWRLSIGRNFESEQKQDDCPPIFKIPYLIINGKQVNQSNEMKLKDHIIIDTRSKLIPLDKFKDDIARLDEKLFHPLILTDEELLLSLLNKQPSYENTVESLISDNKNRIDKNQRKSFDSFTFADLDSLSLQSNVQAQILDTSKILPIVIKEADFAYQCQRVVLFKRLLSGCPYLKDQLIREASIDIPPYFRAQTWAVLLDVNPSKSKVLYDSIDKTTPIATDRQISVDIPRCHQYNELMASPRGHSKLAHILKAWLNYNKTEYVYWQGLDSLAAPFLLLNFDDEAMAFACFNAFVKKYLKGFFKKDNQLIVQQYLSMFSELLSYHDAPLASHLERLGFMPNLYAISWFLTMFTHVLPLHKILHVWDCLLLGDEKYPLCIGLAMLSQLRNDLMEYTFNDCIVAFSDLPEIDIERCIRDASHYYNSTPDKLINLFATPSC